GGRSRRAAPSRSNNGCGATETLIRTSPARPRAPASPWPLRRICCPSASPAGILTSTSLPVGSCTRRLVPLAASASVTVTAAAMSPPRGGGTSSSNWKLPPRAPHPGERLLEDVFEAAEAATTTRASARALEAAGPEAEGFEHALVGARPAASEALEALEARFALGVDLAAVERLALVGVPDD